MGGNLNRTVGVIGLGYVGLPLAAEFALAGYRVHGFDVSSERVAQVNRGESYVGDVDSAVLRRVVDEGRLSATTDEAVLAESDVVIVCVPTPLRKTKDPDVSYIVDAVERCEHEYRRPDTLLPQFAADVVTMHVRYDQVQDYDVVVGCPPRFAQCRISVGDTRKRTTFVGKATLDEGDYSRIVLDEQNVHSRHPQLSSGSLIETTVPRSASPATHIVPR